MIKLEDVTKTYRNGVTALQDVSLDIEKGEFVFVVGPSGSGKSTLIRLLLKEEEATRGDVVHRASGSWMLPVNTNSALKSRSCSAAKKAPNVAD